MKWILIILLMIPMASSIINIGEDPADVEGVVVGGVDAGGGDNSTWNQTLADELYLRLDTANDPLTGTLEMGSNADILMGYNTMLFYEDDGSQETGIWFRDNSYPTDPSNVIFSWEFDGSSTDSLYVDGQSGDEEMIFRLEPRFSEDVFVDTDVYVKDNKIIYLATSGGVGGMLRYYTAGDVVEFVGRDTPLQLRTEFSGLRLGNGADSDAPLLIYGADGQVAGTSNPPNTGGDANHTYISGGIGGAGFGGGANGLNASVVIGRMEDDLSVCASLDTENDLCVLGTTIIDDDLNITGQVTLLDDSYIFLGTDGDSSVGYDSGSDYMRLDTSHPILLGVAEPLHLTLNDGRDAAGIVANSDANAIIRGLTIWAEYDGSQGTATASKPVGLNSFAHIESNDDLTSTNTYGGASGGRYAIRHYGSGTITLGTGVSTNLGLLSSGDILNWRGVQSEASVVAGANTATNYTDFWAGGCASTGECTNRYGLYVSNSDVATQTNQYGIFIEDMTGSTNDYAIYSQGGEVNLQGLPPEATTATSMYVCWDTDGHLFLNETGC